MEKPAIFDLIENYQNKKNDLIEELEIYKKFVFNIYFNNFNILTYSSIFFNGSLECIVKFFSDDSTLDYKFDLNGFNALHTCCYYGLYHNTKFLLENNFSPNTFTKDLKTAAVLAIESNTPTVINILSLLKHYNADFDLLISKYNPIQTAIINGNKNAIMFLIKNNVYIQDNIKQKLIKENNRYAQGLIKKNKKKEELNDLLKELYKESVMLEDKQNIQFFYSKWLRFKLL